MYCDPDEEDWFDPFDCHVSYSEEELKAMKCFDIGLDEWNQLDQRERNRLLGLAKKMKYKV